MFQRVELKRPRSCRIQDSASEDLSLTLTSGLVFSDRRMSQRDTDHAHLEIQSGNNALMGLNSKNLHRGFVSIKRSIK